MPGLANPYGGNSPGGVGIATGGGYFSGGVYSGQPRQRQQGRQLTLEDLLAMIPGFQPIDYRPLLDRYLGAQRAAIASQLAVNQAQVGQALAARGLGASGLGQEAAAILGSRAAAAMAQVASQAIPQFARIDIAQRQFQSQLGATRAELASQWLQFEKRMQFAREQQRQAVLANLFKTLFAGGAGLLTGILTGNPAAGLATYQVVNTVDYAYEPPGTFA